jgi:hypothetical protein
MIAVIFCLLTFTSLLWWTSELPELWIGTIVLLPLIQHLI